MVVYRRVGIWGIGRRRRIVNRKERRGSVCWSMVCIGVYSTHHIVHARNIGWVIFRYETTCRGIIVMYILKVNDTIRKYLVSVLDDIHGSHTILDHLPVSKVSPITRVLVLGPSMDMISTLPRRTLHSTNPAPYVRLTPGNSDR